MRAPNFWYRDDLLSRIKAVASAPLGSLYGLSVAWKYRHAKPYHAPAKVVCVGNLTAGGSGKTPVALALAKIFQLRGKRVVFLSRGYGGTETGPLLVERGKHSAADVGDEPLLLAETAETIVARDRSAGAKLADSHGVDVIIMDDGHQNFTLKKDLSLVVIDAQTRFGNGFVMPSGPLREPVKQGLDRADAVILMGDGFTKLEQFSGPVIRACLRPIWTKDLERNRYLAFAGIGRPEKFFAMLRALHVDVLATHAFPDHHHYKDGEISGLREAALGLDAKPITTQKDFVRLSEEEREGIEVLQVEAAFHDVEVLDDLITRFEQKLSFGKR